jgi:phosphoribosylanthranilate isomerase
MTSPPIVQIYEIQTPEEARAVIRLGVDHVGSVITCKATRHDPVIRETIRTVREAGAVSSLIPLFTDAEAVFDSLVYYQPDIIHFCEQVDRPEAVSAAVELQSSVRRRFPDIRIMRAIPIARQVDDGGDAVLELAARFADVSDFFLTDTVLVGNGKPTPTDQPVNGFVGITGLTCDWEAASRLVAASPIPVILAGGISPENVAEAIARIRPYGVDSCTQTNARDDAGTPIRFKKDLARVDLLIDRARRAGRCLQPA